MKLKSLIISTIAILVMVSVGAVYAFAETDQEKLDNVQKQTEDLQGQVGELEQSILDQAAELKEINQQVAEKQNQLTDIQLDIEKTKQEMQDREDGLNARLRAMYKNGSAGYLDVLLGSKSISEFISNVDMIKKIYSHDAGVMDTLKEERTALEEKENNLANKTAELKLLQSNAQSQKESLEADKGELEAQIDKLNEEADSLKDKIASLQNPDNPYQGGKFAWPVPGNYIITSEFGYRLHPILGVWKGHTGVDIGVSSGTPVHAAASGTVIMSEWYGGYGYAVVIDHGGGISTLYGHNSSLAVSTGQKVAKGDVISYSGSTGWSTGPHLHFEVRINGDYVDPMTYF